METFYFLLSGVVGLIIGSFLNVIIYRVPEGKSIIWPSSRCPSCDHPLQWRDNIPLLSYLSLRGKCRYCGQPISLQYPIVETSSALLLIISFAKFGLSVFFVAATFFLLILLTVAVIDLQRQIIPNRIIIPAIIISGIAWVASALSRSEILPLIGMKSWPEALIGILIGGGLLLLAALVRPGGMGGGDIKLAGFMGIFLGRYVIMALFIGFLIGSVAGVASMILFHKTRKDLLPFGPFLSLGAVITLFFGLEILKWYLRLSGIR